MSSPPNTMRSAAGRSAPTHVAVIMDGNGRWAQARGLPRFEGHRRGVEAAAMAFVARQSARLRPPAIAVHDDGDVAGRRPGDAEIFVIRRHEAS